MRTAAYGSESLLTTRGREHHLDLATALGATPGGLVEHPVFFSGFLARPDVAAAGLLAVADVAGSRYVDVGLMARLANLDPVITASGDRLRFESFSACNGVHARFDLLREGLGSAEVGWGTTNIDVNQPLRTALARVGPGEPLHLSVGHREVRAALPEVSHLERKVTLPDRWVRGFAELPTILAAMTPAARLPAAAGRELLASLPRVSPPGPDLHLVPTPRGIKRSVRPTRGAIPVIGAARLRGADRLLPHLTSLAIHQHRSGASAWVLDVPGGRLTLVVSAGPYRGFSGEGGLLALLAHPTTEEIGTWLQAELCWSPIIDPAALAAATGLGAAEVERGLAWLAASGRLGFDLVEDALFHRELPIDASRVLRRNPRLVSAEKLVASGKVRTTSTGWTVEGARGTSYDVTVDPPTCACRWCEEHGSDRGPCKHQLAVRLFRLAEMEGNKSAGSSVQISEQS